MLVTETEKLYSSVPATVDFSIEEPNFLDKNKFGVYVCTYVAAERIIKDLELMKELKPGGFRYDPGWGFGNHQERNSPRELNAPQISGCRNNLQINFTDFDKVTHALQQQSTEIMYVHAYNPIPLQDTKKNLPSATSDALHNSSNWNTKPNDMTAWEKINYEYALHWKQKNWKVTYYEIWNEPDLQPVFFQGSKEDFFELYQYAVAGIKKADPDALVGGPAISFDQSWITPFLNYVKDNHLPLDFFSYHTYGDSEVTVNAIHDIVRQNSGFENIEMVITEYNSFIPATQDFSTGGSIERYPAAARLLHDFKFFLGREEIRRVYWAQLNDPEVYGNGVDRCGLISIDGHRKASFNAYKIYADMPLRRCRFQTDCSTIEGMASSDMHRACIVMWNLSDCEKQISLKLDGICYASCLLTVYRIDAAHGSYCDSPDKEELESDCQQVFPASAPVFWNGLLPSYGVVYLVAESF